MREGNFYLRVKIKSLDEEVRIIRHEMKKVYKSWRYFKKKFQEAEAGTSEHANLDDEVEKAEHVHGSLVRHMSDVVKWELRSSLIALAFVKGKPYSSVERYTRSMPNWERIETIAKRYRRMNFFWDPMKTKALDAEWDAWLKAALEHVYLSFGGYSHLKEKDALKDAARRKADMERYKAQGQILKAPPNHFRGPPYFSWPEKNGVLVIPPAVKKPEKRGIFSLLGLS